MAQTSVAGVGHGLLRGVHGHCQSTVDAQCGDQRREMHVEEQLRGIRSVPPGEVQQPGRAGQRIYMLLARDGGFIGAVRPVQASE